MSDSDPLSTCLYLAKLQRRGAISPEAVAAFDGLPATRREFDTFRDIVREGQQTTHSCFLESGVVSRYRTLRNGARQILSFHIRGDMIDLQSVLLPIADHGIRTHVPTRVLEVPHAAILDVAARFPELGRALWFDTLVDAAIFREWTVNVGRRSARERTAHLLLEFQYRLREVGLAEGDTFPMPISQADLSDALGISPVHLSRTLQALRKDRLITMFSRTVVIEDPERMATLAGFDTTYLHPEGPRRVA